VRCLPRALTLNPATALVPDDLDSPLPGPNRLASVRTVTEIEREVLAVRADVLDEIHHPEDPAGRRADDELVGAGENDRLVGVGVGGAPAEPVGAADRVDIARGVLQPALSHRSGTRDVEDALGVGALVIHETRRPAGPGEDRGPAGQGQAGAGKGHGHVHRRARV
jgi:hypothetical protein